MKKIIALFVFGCSFSTGSAQQISLAGKWEVRLETNEKKIYFIQLPGTLDDAGVGEPVSIKPSLTIATLAHLQRKVQYTGKAYYRKSFTIPASWRKSQITLALGRVLWQSQISIDGKVLPVKEQSLSVSHTYDISEYVTPGRMQELVITIDNSNIFPGINIYATQYPSKESAEMTHAYTNHTQIKWNGILGNITLSRKPAVNVENVEITSSVASKKILVQYHLNKTSKQKTYLELYVIDPATKRKWEQRIKKQMPEANNLTAEFAIPKDAVLWNEFSPKLYQLVTITHSDAGNDTLTTSFGIRDFHTKDGDLFLNDNRIFIRSNLECIIFPLTGYPLMKSSQWEELFKKAKSYGLNSFRFHSWCPPEAAFAAADKTGFYLQVELPHWNLKVGSDTAAFEFLRTEAKRILAAYGNHPSFMFFSMGNELEGDFSKLNALVAELKKIDKRHLYSTTTFTFQKEITGAPQPEDDFYVTQWTKKGWVRGQGVFNSEPPGFSKDFNQSVEGVGVPLISHEIGQYSVFPDLNEIPAYTGNLVPNNFIAVREDLSKKGMVHLAPAFLQASGKLAFLLYKEEVERAMKTKGMDGFQLLQLQDFPGQGTALVGLLNSFWKSKGIITPKQFHAFCSEVTPLIRFSKAVYSTNEKFSATVELSNFYKKLENVNVSWKIRMNSGSLLATGKFPKRDYPIDNCLMVGEIEYPLHAIKKAQQLTIEVTVDGTAYKNEWNVWVYPSDLTLDSKDVFVTTSLEDAINELKKGRKVLLSPFPDLVKGIDGKFVPVFWSPVHFPDQPGTMGLLIKQEHKALKDFPTDFYSNWQWWDLTTKSKTLYADTLPDKAIIVRVIDNFVRNQNLTNLFEAKLGKGHLVFCSIDIISDLDKRPQAKQLQYSLLKYMNSKDFAPEETITEELIRNYFK